MIKVQMIHVKEMGCIYMNAFNKIGNEYPNGVSVTSKGIHVGFAHLIGLDRILLQVQIFS
jgi:hypothetical protein